MVKFGIDRGGALIDVAGGFIVAMVEWRLLVASGNDQRYQNSRYDAPHQ